MTLPLFRLLPAALLVAACSAPDNPVRTAPGGTTEIALQDGRNCYNNQCLRYSRAQRSVSVTNKYPVRIPRDIDVRDGYVTPADFAAMFQTANMAYSAGVGRR
ncbi:hypothetical protein ACFMPD_00310 [Sedimentitalea sp. HM32M-2]|uniref:hypothetical protein n=1 Tax=Sedimentitalea sp. HM32M-2 TaxID=3351566 RepID=UPI0036275B2C